jgi:hypothetical protein
MVNGVIPMCIFCFFPLTKKDKILPVITPGCISWQLDDLSFGTDRFSPAPYLKVHLIPPHAGISVLLLRLTSYSSRALFLRSVSAWSKPIRWSTRHRENCQLGQVGENVVCRARNKINLI